MLECNRQEALTARIGHALWLVYDHSARGTLVPPVLESSGLSTGFHSCIPSCMLSWFSEYAPSLFNHKMCPALARSHCPCLPSTQAECLETATQSRWEVTLAVPCIACFPGSHGGRWEGCPLLPRCHWLLRQLRTGHIEGDTSYNR